MEACVSDLPINSNIINFVTSNTSNILGLKIINSPLKDCMIELGDYVIIRYHEVNIILCKIGNYNKSELSHSKIKKFLNELRNHQNLKLNDKIYVSLNNLNEWCCKRILNILKSTFKRHRITVCKFHDKIIKGREIKSITSPFRGFQSPIINCEVNQHNFIALVDTGAEISLIDVKYLPKELKFMRSDTSTKLQGITGNQIDIKGIIEVEIKFEDRKFTTELHVIDGAGMEYPLLLGMDTLMKGGFVIDLREMSITCQGKQINHKDNLRKNYTEVNNLKLKFQQEVCIPMGEHKDIEFKLPKNADNAIFEEIKYNNNLSKLRYFQRVFDMKDGKSMIIRIVNTTCKDVNIKPKIDIGKLLLLKERHVRTTSVDRKRVMNVLQNNDIKEEIHSKEIWSKIKTRIEDISDLENFRELILENSDAFAKDEKDLGCVKDFEHHLELTDNTPIACKPYRMPYSKIEIVEGEIKKMLELGVIKPSISPYAAPCLIVWKKNGKPRLVIDYRKLNQVVKPIQYPLPHLETSIQSLGGNSYFSTLDLLSGYHQIKLREEDTSKTAFTTGRGLYEFTRTPFGLITSGAAMQSVIERVLNGLNNKICLVYIDDVIVVGKTLEEHDKNLSLVLERLKNFGYKVSIQKCTFRAKQVECLGHVISSKGILPNPDKVEALLKKQIPKTIKQVKSFLGAAGYYRRFIHNYSTIAYPLTELVKKDKKFGWTTSCQEAYDEILDKLTNPPVLTYPNYNRKFIVTTDASLDGIGAVLSQEDIEGKERPLAYYSRKLNHAEKNYPVFHLEGLAIKTALQKWRYYLLGHEILVRSDNQPIIAVFKSKQCEGRLAKYLSVLQEYKISFQYLPGKVNVIADFLSRSCDEANEIKNNINVANKNKKETYVVSQNRLKTVPHIKDLYKEQQNDKYICQLMENPRFNIVTIDNLVYSESIKDKKTKLLVPSSKIQDFIQHFHNKVCSHLGFKKTYECVKEYLYWPNMMNDVKSYVKKCHICKISKYDHTNKCVMGEFPKSEQPFERIHTDIMGPFKKARFGYKYVLVIVDSFSRYIVAKPLTKKCSKGIIEILSNEIIKKFGTPNIIVSDFGTEYTSAEYTNFCMKEGIQIQYTPPYHHSTNGLVERVNYTLESLLRCAIAQQKGSWIDHLQAVVNSVNCTKHEATKCCPYDILGIKRLTNVSYLDNVKSNREIDFQKIKDNNTKYKRNYLDKLNKYRRNFYPERGQFVYTKVTNNRGKLFPVYEGPFKLIKIDNHMVTVELPNGKTRILHIDFIKI